MATSQQIIERRIQFEIDPGVRVRFDPELVDEEGSDLAANKIIVMTPGIVIASEQPNATPPTFDLQNVTIDPLVCDVIAQYDHSVQLNAAQAIQAAVGTGGADPSPAAPINNDALLSAIAQGSSVGTGALQNIAHGLGVIPRAVVVFTTGGPNGTDYTIVLGAHTALNLLITATLNIEYDWVAFA